MKDAAGFFAVLADETRLRMMWLLFNHEELCVCDLVEALGITQSKASRHLATMRHAGVVTDRKAGLWSYYSLRRPTGELARRHLDVLRATLSREPEAAALLASLDRWLGAKGHGTTCATGTAATERLASGIVSSATGRRVPRAADRTPSRAGTQARARQRKPATTRGQARRAGDAR